MPSEVPPHPPDLRGREKKSVRFRPQLRGEKARAPRNSLASSTSSARLFQARRMRPFPIGSAGR